MAQINKAQTENDLPRVELKTSKGDVVIELFEDEAPNTVANFIQLVEKKYYDGLKFHRVIDGFMAQGGCPKGTGTAGPGYSIACECQLKGARKHARGSLSMAHAGRDTGGSQFFITFAATPVNLTVTLRAASTASSSALKRWSSVSLFRFWPGA